MQVQDGRELLAANIRQMAKTRGIALNTLADLSGVSRAQMYDVLAGRKAATLDWVGKIAGTLDVQIHELLLPKPPEEIG